MRVSLLVHTEEMLAMMLLCSDPVPMVRAQKLDQVWEIARILYITVLHVQTVQY